MNRGIALSRLGRWPEAIEYARKAARLLPDDPQTNQRAAWLLATHTPEQGGDGIEAVELALRACELTPQKDKDIVCLDTLAAAYASAGRFDEAIATVKKALQLAQAAGQDSAAAEIHMRLQLYRERKRFTSY